MAVVRCLTPTGCWQAVLVVTLLLARLGRQGAELVACSGDGAWLVQLTTAAWLVINPVIIIGILMDTPMSWTLVRCEISCEHQRCADSWTVTGPHQFPSNQCIF